MISLLKKNDKKEIKEYLKINGKRKMITPFIMEREN